MEEETRTSHGFVNRLNTLEREVGSIATSVHNIENQYRGVMGAIEGLRNEVNQRGKTNWSAIAVILTIGALAFAPLHNKDVETREALIKLSDNFRSHELKAGHPERVLQEMQLRSELLEAKIAAATGQVMSGGCRE